MHLFGDVGTSNAARRWGWWAKAVAAKPPPGAASCARSQPTAGEIRFRTDKGAEIDVARLGRKDCGRCGGRCR